MAQTSMGALTIFGVRSLDFNDEVHRRKFTEYRMLTGETALGFDRDLFFAVSCKSSRTM